MITPSKLQPGMTVGLICTSGPVAEDRIAPAIRFIEGLGLKYKLGASVGERLDYLAGSDEVRARDLNAMFADDKVQAVISMRGGYGAARILDRIDYGLIRRKPKIFAGYSDVTALHTAINQLSGLVTYHSPMPASEPSLDDFTLKSFTDNIFGTGNPSFGGVLSVVVPGTCEAVLCGGNLSVLAGLMGTKYELDCRGKILFLEDLNEAPYKIDRMLTQFRLAGKFSDCAGIVLGSFKNCGDIQDIMLSVMPKLDKPCVSGLPCGHTMPTLTLPLGARICIKEAALCICNPDDMPMCR